MLYRQLSRLYANLHGVIGVSIAPVDKTFHFYCEGYAWHFSTAGHPPLRLSVVAGK